MLITEIEGFDNLHHPEDLLLEAQQNVAKLYGTRESFYSVNGSTAALLAAISAAVPRNGQILVARNCHKAVYHAIYLRNLKPAYIYPQMDSEWWINGGIFPDKVERCLAENPEIQAVLITSPTYDGVVSDVKEIAEIAHKYGVPLIVDDNTVVVVVDTNKPSYTECEELLYMTKTIVVLDHHRRGNEVIQNAVLSYVEPYASSTCEMVAEILQYFSDDLRLRNIEADCIYAGIMIDTNNFITRAGVRTFEAAAFLRRSGADMTRVRKMLRDNIDSYKARAEAVRTAEIYRGCFAIAKCPSEGLESPTVVGAQAANELLDISEIKASFVLTEYNGKIYVSARSIDEVNVQVIMEKLGGGGHMNASGAQFNHTDMDEAVACLKQVLDNMIKEGDI